MHSFKNDNYVNWHWYSIYHKMTSVIWPHTVIKQCFTYPLENKNPEIKKIRELFQKFQHNGTESTHASMFMAGFLKIKMLMVVHSQGGPYILWHFFLLKDKNKLVSKGYWNGLTSDSAGLGSRPQLVTPLCGLSLLFILLLVIYGRSFSSPGRNPM